AQGLRSPVSARAPLPRGGGRMAANAGLARVSVSSGAGSDRGDGGTPRTPRARPVHRAAVCGSVAAVQRQPIAGTGRAPPTREDRSKIRRLIAPAGAIVLAVASRLFTPAVPDGF